MAPRAERAERSMEASELRGAFPGRRRERPRLPKLEGIANKRAQAIIADQMNRSALEDPSGSTMAVLAKVESTAPRTAPTHDISHLLDHSKPLAPHIPPSLIHPRDHIYEASFLPKDATSIYHEEDGLWHTRIFPSNTPSSRSDARLLDAWVTKALENYRADDEEEFVADGPVATAREYRPPDEGEVVGAMRGLVPILSVALHEIVRQVTHHCPERGKVLQKIWSAYVALFERVLQVLRRALEEEKSHATEMQQLHAAAKRDMSLLKLGHPEQMQVVIGDLEERFTERQSASEVELMEAEQEGAELRRELQHRREELEAFYPNFLLYQDSPLKNQIPHRNIKRRAGAVGELSAHARPATHRARRRSEDDEDDADTADEETQSEPEHREEDFRSQQDFAPEVAMAEDFKRLLTAMQPQRRKAVGAELSGVLGAAAFEKEKAAAATTGSNIMERLRFTQVTAEVRAKAAEEARQAQLKADVAEQEAQIKSLKEEIAELERRAKEGKLLEVSEPSLQKGVDRDGLVLTNRRATASPMEAITSLPGGLAPRRGRLQLPGQ